MQGRVGERDHDREQRCRSRSQMSQAAVHCADALRPRAAQPTGARPSSSWSAGYRRATTAQARALRNTPRARNAARHPKYSASTPARKRPENPPSSVPDVSSQGNPGCLARFGLVAQRADRGSQNAGNETAADQAPNQHLRGYRRFPRASSPPRGPSLPQRSLLGVLPGRRPAPRTVPSRLPRACPRLP